MSRKHRQAPRLLRDGADVNRQSSGPPLTDADCEGRKPAGRIASAGPTGEPDSLAFWLPDGVTAADIRVDPLRNARAI